MTVISRLLSQSEKVIMVNIKNCHYFSTELKSFIMIVSQVYMTTKTNIVFSNSTVKYFRYTKSIKLVNLEHF